MCIYENNRYMTCICMHENGCVYMKRSFHQGIEKHLAATASDFSGKSSASCFYHSLISRSCPVVTGFYRMTLYPWAGGFSIPAEVPCSSDFWLSWEWVSKWSGTEVRLSSVCTRPHVGSSCSEDSAEFEWRHLAAHTRLGAILSIL